MEYIFLREWWEVVFSESKISFWEFLKYVGWLAFVPWQHRRNEVWCMSSGMLDHWHSSHGSPGGMRFDVCPQVCWIIGTRPIAVQAKMRCNIECKSSTLEGLFNTRLNVGWALMSNLNHPEIKECWKVVWRRVTWQGMSVWRWML